jgi:hypothetical protein
MDSDSSSPSSLPPSSEAEMYLVQIAADVGIDKNSAVLKVVCQRMKEEYLVSTWQLSVLDSYQWQQLGAPIGLAAAVRYHSTTARIQLGEMTTTSTTTTIPFETPEKFVPLSPTLEIASSTICSLGEAETEQSVTTATISRKIFDNNSHAEKKKDQEKNDNHVPELLRQQSPVQRSPANNNNNDSDHHQTPTEESHVKQFTVDNLSHESSSDFLNKQVDESFGDGKHPSVDMVVGPFKSGNPVLLTKCFRNVDISNSTESKTIFKDEHDSDNDDEDISSDKISVQKLDLDTFFRKGSPQSSSDNDHHTIPSITLTGSSDDDEEDDPDEVAQLVGSLGKKESRLWLDRNIRDNNDDDATVVVSNVSPERKNAVRQELDKKNFSDGKSFYSPKKCQNVLSHLSAVFS